jgi:DNA-directed RNA polymerase specialized sigma subunit
MKMTEITTLQSLDQEAGFRLALQEYLVDLPILDREVLRLSFGEGRLVSEISLEFQISAVHVQRILGRALTFATEQPVSRKFVPQTRLRSCSPVSCC